MKRHTGRTALYRLFNADGDLLYIGMTWNPNERWRTHARQRRWWSEVSRHELTWFDTRTEAQRAEKLAIIAEKPPYNTCHTPLHLQISDRQRVRSLSPEERERWNWMRIVD